MFSCNRRDALKVGLASACWIHGGGAILADATSRALPEATAKKLPRWRGFNLLQKFQVGSASPFAERDFAEIAELGFNFVRLPMDYRCWTKRSQPRVLDEPVLREVDQAVAFGKKHGVHVQLNFHRAPGFTVAEPPEPTSLWTDEETQAVCAHHWKTFATRYAGRPNAELSFNLFNEPDDKVTPAQHRHVVSRVVEAIRSVDAARLIVCDGRAWATRPPTELLGLGVAAAAHDYHPMPLTHYRASWVRWDKSWPAPAWPQKDRDGQVVNRVTIERLIAPWKQLEGQGMGVMVGEFGCHNQTPHPVVLAWVKDTLSVIQQAGFGWALWNYTGSFGIIDSGRTDAAYETWHGRKLDRALLDLLLTH